MCLEITIDIFFNNRINKSQVKKIAISTTFPSKTSPKSTTLFKASLDAFQISDYEPIQ